MSVRAERMFVVSLGNRLRFLRRVRRLTTRQLAARSGLAPATVNAVELGARVPSAIVLLRLAAGLQVPWVALVEPTQEDVERLLREARTILDVPFPLHTSAGDQVEGAARP